MNPNYKLPQYVEKRVRFFPEQDLFAQDSIDEQNYHIDRQRRHSRTLHVSGICDGLTVGVEGKAISVDAGTALDQTGRLIVLGQKREISVTDTNSEQKLVIFYDESASDPAGEGSAHGNTRWYEKPKLEILPKNEKVPEGGVCLATLKIKSNGEVEVDNTIRQYSGVYLPAGDGKGVTLRTHGEENLNIAVLDGSLRISGTLAVTGHTQLNDTLTVTESTIIKNNLTVKSLIVGENETGFTLRSQRQENQNLAILDGSLSISGTLSVAGESILTGHVNANGRLLTVTNKGTGEIASFQQEGWGGGVLISGIKGKNNALNLTDNTTEDPTLAVTNSGRGDSLYVMQKGEGRAALFRGGKVEVDNSLTVTGSTQLNNTLNVNATTNLKELNVSGAITVEGHTTLKGSVNIYGKWERKGYSFPNRTAAQELVEIAPITAQADGFVVAWIRTREARGILEIYVAEEKQKIELNNIDQMRATVTVDIISNQAINCNSVTVPVKKGETWKIRVVEPVSPCEWICYWIPFGNP